jgi:hypothetical protein
MARAASTGRGARRVRRDRALETPRNLLSARTGTGRYDGIVYANGASSDGHFYDIGGTSRFDVDFSNHRYSGSLLLSASNGPSFGTWTFNSTMVAGLMLEANFTQDPGGSIQPRFYGPDGQEIGATFRLTSGALGAAGAVSISGVTVAKRGP